MPVYQLPKEPVFPHPCEAVQDGLLAVGGDLSPERLIAAYSTGIFPWYGDNDPILWWSPDPRMILIPDNFKVSKSLKKSLKKEKFNIRVDFAFEEIIDNCSKIPRNDQNGTWITDEMKHAYIKMHKLGLAHSFETWEENKLVGGLYGISLGRAFFGESMFHKRTDASKIAFYYLSIFAKKHNFSFIDCQLPTTHLASLGANEISRTDFLDLLAEAMKYPACKEKWNFSDL
jgi:leucyl/phenylalanyl-tRNA--protein transferase